MGEFTFAEFKSYLKLIFSNNEDLEEPTDYYGIWTNSAYRHLTTRNRFWGLKKNFYFPQLETSNTSTTTTDGTATISVPSDCLVIRHLFDETNNRYIEPITWKKYIRYPDRDTASSEGDAQEWVRSGTSIYLHPTPSTTGDSIYIYYRKIPAELSTESGTTDIGEEWDEPIIHLAAYKGFMWTNEFEKAKVHKEEFAELTASLIGIYDSERVMEEMAKPHPLWAKR